MIEYLLDIGSPAGVGIFIYFVMSRKFDELKECVMNKHLTNSKKIAYIEGILKIDN